MDLGHVQQKPVEVRQFLYKMKVEESRVLGEPFYPYLNAFLAAAMSVRDPFFRDKTVKPWLEEWEKSLTPDHQHLWDSMREGRNDEAHIARKSRPARSGRRARKAGLKLCVGQEDIKVGVGAPYSDRSISVEGFGSAAIRVALGSNTTAVIHKKTYSFDIDGNQRKVTAVCDAYLVLLERMVTKYQADHPFG